MDIRKLLVFLSALSLFLIGCDSTEQDWQTAASKNTINSYKTFLANHPQGKFHDRALSEIESIRFETTKQHRSFEEYSKFLADYPDSTRRLDITKEMENLADERLRQSFMAVVTAVKTGKTVLDADVVNHSGYEEAGKLLDEILHYFPNHALAANNRAVLAVEENNFEKARSLFKIALEQAKDTQVKNLALHIGIASKDNSWLSDFYMPQPADLKTETTASIEHEDTPDKQRDPFILTLTMSTIGAAQLNFISSNTCPHVVADKTRNTFLLKKEVENNIRALNALLDPSAHYQC